MTSHSAQLSEVEKINLQRLKMLTTNLESNVADFEMIKRLWNSIGLEYVKRHQDKITTEEVWKYLESASNLKIDYSELQKVINIPPPWTQGMEKKQNNLIKIIKKHPVIKELAKTSSSIDRIKPMIDQLFPHYKNVCRSDEWLYQWFGELRI